MQITMMINSGLHRFDNIEDAKATCVEGKHLAKGTTQEVGISTTYCKIHLDQCSSRKYVIL